MPNRQWFSYKFVKNNSHEFWENKYKVQASCRNFCFLWPSIESTIHNLVNSSILKTVSALAEVHERVHLFKIGNPYMKQEHPQDTMTQLQSTLESHRCCKDTSPPVPKTFYWNKRYNQKETLQHGRHQTEVHKDEETRWKLERLCESPLRSKHFGGKKLLPQETKMHMLHSKIEGFCFTQAIDDQVHIHTSSVLLLWKAIFSVFRPWSSGRGKSNISKYRMSDVCPTISTQQHNPCIRTVTDKPPPNCDWWSPCPPNLS